MFKPQRYAHFIAGAVLTHDVIFSSYVSLMYKSTIVLKIFAALDETHTQTYHRSSRIDKTQFFPWVASAAYLHVIVCIALDFSQVTALHAVN